MESKALVKRKIRGYQRLIRKDGLAATVRQETERKIKALELQLEQLGKSELERDLSSKYRMVRFFERRKLIRLISSTSNKLAKLNEEESPEDHKQLSQKLLKLRADLYYVQNFPKTRKYIALFPNTDSSNELVDAFREALREAIATELAAGLDAEKLIPLDADIRFKALFDANPIAKPKRVKPIVITTPKQPPVEPKKRQPKKLAQQEDEDEEEDTNKQPVSPPALLTAPKKKRKADDVEHDQDIAPVPDVANDDFFAPVGTQVTPVQREEYVVDKTDHRPENSSRRAWLRQVKQQRTELSKIGQYNRQAQASQQAPPRKKGKF